MSWYMILSSLKSVYDKVFILYMFSIQKWPKNLKRRLCQFKYLYTIQNILGMWLIIWLIFCYTTGIFSIRGYEKGFFDWYLYVMWPPGIQITTFYFAVRYCSSWWHSWRSIRVKLVGRSMFGCYVPCLPNLDPSFFWLLLASLELFSVPVWLFCAYYSISSNQWTTTKSHPIIINFFNPSSINNHYIPTSWHLL